MQVTKRVFQPLLCLMVLLTCLSVALPQRAEASAGQIVAQPANAEITAGYTAQFAVEATGVTAYKWQYRRSETAAWVNTTMTGYKTATLSVPAILARDGYQYRCRITATDGAVLYTDAATLTVNNSIIISAAPTRQIVNVNADATFSVTANGNGLTYQWQYRKNSEDFWKKTTLTGYTTDTLTVNALLGRNGYQYRCAITDENGIKIYTTHASLSALGFTAQPTDQTAAVGTNAIFKAPAAGQSLSYQWQYRKSSSGSWMATSLTGAKTDTLSVGATASRNGYQYRCRITDALNVVVYSDAATLTVGEAAPVTTYTVTFKDYDGTVLKTQTVESGKAATAPADPSREGYVFTGWDKNFSNVTTNLVVTAVYEAESTEPQFYGSTVTTTAGSTDVNFAVSLKNNPGILGMLLSIEYDEDIFTLTKTSNGEATAELTYQKPSKLVSGCNFVWYGTQTGEVIDGTVLNLVFSVSADAPAGTYPIKITCSGEDTYDAEYNTISATVVDGTIVVGSPAPATTYTVTFKDYDGTVLKTETVESGKAATAPADPSREGYVFTGWDKDFSNITANLVVTAVYEAESTEPQLYGTTVTTAAGSTGVNYTVSIKNNPGILGMLLSVEYDEDVLTLTKTSNGDATAELTYQKPSKLVSGCNFVWYGTETGEVIDGTVLNLVFSVAADAPAGSYPIKITYSGADTYDAEYNTVSATVVDGVIIVK